MKLIGAAAVIAGVSAQTQYFGTPYGARGYPVGAYGARSYPVGAYGARARVGAYGYGGARFGARAVRAPVATGAVTVAAPAATVAAPASLLPAGMEKPKTLEEAKEMLAAMTQEEKDAILASARSQAAATLGVSIEPEEPVDPAEAAAKAALAATRFELKRQDGYIFGDVLAEQEETINMMMEVGSLSDQSTTRLTEMQTIGTVHQDLLAQKMAEEMLKKGKDEGASDKELMALQMDVTSAAADTAVALMDLYRPDQYDTLATQFTGADLDYRMNFETHTGILAQQPSMISAKGSMDAYYDSLVNAVIGKGSVDDIKEAKAAMIDAKWERIGNMGSALGDGVLESAYDFAGATVGNPKPTYELFDYMNAAYHTSGAQNAKTNQWMTIQDYRDAVAAAKASKAQKQDIINDFKAKYNGASPVAP